MKITTKQPEVKPNVVLELTPEEFEVIKCLCGRVGGDPSNFFRKVTDEIFFEGKGLGYVDSIENLFPKVSVVINVGC